MPVNTQTVTLSSAATSGPLPLKPFLSSGAPLQPALLAFVSSGANLTYNVEVTGDNIQSSTYSAATGNWVPFTGMSGLTASAAQTLGAVVTAVRLRVTSYTSGSVTLQFIQVTA